MKIIKKGSIEIEKIEKHVDSAMGRIQVIRLWPVDYKRNKIKYCKLSGKEKITIVLSDTESGENPTIVSIRDKWKYYRYNNDLSVLVDIKSLYTDVIFFNIFLLKTEYDIEV